MVPMLLWKHELHFGGGFGKIRNKNRLYLPQTDRSTKALMEKLKLWTMRFSQTGWLRHTVCRA